MNRLPTIVVAITLLAGCSGPSVRIDRDGGSDIEDLRTAGNNDAAVTGDCELPYYAAVIVSNSGSGTAKGRVERIPLDGRARCKPLTLGNTLPYDATAVAFLPPDKIAVGALSGVYTINIATDKVGAPVYKPAMFAWVSLVDDLFPIRHPDGNTLLAIAYDESNLGGSKTIEYLVTVDGDQEVSRWLVGSSEVIRVSFDPVGMAASVNDPQNFFVLKGLSDQYAAGEFVPPWDEVPVEVNEPLYQLNLGSTGSALTIKTLRQDKGGSVLKRTVWTFRPSTSSGYQVYMVNQLDDQKKQLLGPYICEDPRCSKDPYDPYTDSGPDFTDDTAVIAICSDAVKPSSVNHVVRIRDNGTCEVLLDGNDLLSQEYPLRLAPVYEEP